jgi:hypothetical protein
VDGVISLFDFGLDGPPPGRFETVDGMVHFISGTAGEHLLGLQAQFDLVWCTGWEEKANEYLVGLLGLAQPLPYLTFETHYARWPAGGPASPQPPTAPEPPTESAPERHWKLDAIEAHAGERPLAWVDDGLTPACQEWAVARAAPTLLVPTEPATGLGPDHVQALAAWASSLRGPAEPGSGSAADDRAGSGS